MDAVENLDGVRGWLSDEERGRAERFRREADARAFVFRRTFLRAVLTRYAGIARAELRFERGEFGKPSLAGTSAPVRFNSSSSGGQGQAGVTAGRDIGVDVERADERLLGAEELRWPVSLQRRWHNTNGSSRKRYQGYLIFFVLYFGQATELLDNRKEVL
jgi:hypothetical protein